MSEIPETINGQIAYFERHLPVWAADPGAIGLTAGQVAEIAARTSAARAGFDAAEAARRASKSATLVKKERVRGMLDLGTALVATVRAFADTAASTEGDSAAAAVYARAAIAPIGEPSPLPPPAQAKNLTATLRNSGAIELRWKGTVANGTFYTVWRRLGAGRAFELLGSVSAKRFVDSTLPAATAEAMYFLRTHRDELTSDACEPIVVRLGVVASGTGNTGTQMGVAAMAA